MRLRGYMILLFALVSHELRSLEVSSDLAQSSGRGQRCLLLGHGQAFCSSLDQGTSLESCSSGLVLVVRGTDTLSTGGS